MQKWHGCCAKSSCLATAFVYQDLLVTVVETATWLEYFVMGSISCPVKMLDRKPCGRPTHIAPSGCDVESVCLMHSRDQNKPQDQFDEEINEILAGHSAHHRPHGLFDFCKFAFPVADFSGAIFTQTAFFRRATFNKEVNFSSVTFHQNADFGGAIFSPKAFFRSATFINEVNFNGAVFIQDADFMSASFSLAANFSETKFHEAAIFYEAVFGPMKHASSTGAHTPGIADFRHAQFQKPELVRFIRTNANKKKESEGLRARFMNCHVEGVQFDAVGWHQHNGRMVLQDELDILEQAERAPSYEEAAIAYRRLIINFEKARAYDLVEECTIGEFEMKRRDPSRFLFVGLLSPLYKRFPLLRRWIGEQVSVVGIYRLASVYGTSYYRALFVLGFLLIGFGLLFSTVVDIKPMNVNAISICGQSSSGGVLCAGLTHAVEVAALQKDLLYVPVSSSGRMTEVLEQALIAGQVALLLFALRRRFRR